MYDEQGILCVSVCVLCVSMRKKKKCIFVILSVKMIYYLILFSFNLKMTGREGYKSPSYA